MIETYSHIYLCPQCEEKWLARYFKPLRVPKKNKVCPKCVKKSKVRINGGNTYIRCETCSHFTPCSKKQYPWGDCKLGLSSDPDEGWGLVYSYDVCDQYTPNADVDGEEEDDSDN